MAINDETIRLVLELTGSKTIQDATSKLEEFRKAAVGAKESYDVMARAGEGYRHNSSGSKRQPEGERCRE